MQARERKKAQTRAAILRACGALFRTWGFDGTSIDQIAAEADISRQTFFNYFDGKDAVLAELGLEWLETQANIPETGAKRAGGRPVLDGMRAAIAAQARAMEADRAFVALVVTRSSLFAPNVAGAQIGAIFEAVANVIRAGQASGEIAPDTDPRAAAELLVSALFMTVRLWAGGHWGAAAPLEDRLLAALDLIERGLRNRGVGA